MKGSGEGIRPVYRSTYTLDVLSGARGTGSVMHRLQYTVMVVRFMPSHALDFPFSFTHA